MLISLSIKTTWLDYNNDKIIEIVMIKFNKKDFSIIDTFSSLVNPRIDIPELITDLTNISNLDVDLKPDINDLKDKIIDFIWELPILWHNISFDIKFLLNNNINLKNNILIDTYFLANILFYENHSLNLDALINNYNLTNNWLNGALNNAKSTIELFKFQITKLNTLEKKQKELLSYIFSKSLDNWFNYIYKNYLFNVDNIDKTIFLKYIVWLFKKIEKKARIIKDKQNNNKINFESIIDNVKDLEIRDNQIIMSDIIKDSLNNNLKWVIEAPTWVWKTFAYLIPSIIYSIKTWEQVFISTSTKTLQDQIFYKDLDYLERKLDISFSYSKLKWKSNYFWIYNFLNFFDENDYFDENKTSFLWKIVLWLFKTNSFELDELNFISWEYYMRNDINADSLLTFSNKNPYSNREPLVIQRKKAKTSDIVIINNNILFQDIDIEGSILWKVKNLILDESHTLEDIVTNSLKKTISIIDLNNIFDKIYIILNKNKIKIESFNINCENILFDLDNLFSIYNDYLNTKIKSGEKHKNTLLKQDFYQDYIWDIDIKTIILSILSKILNIKDSLSILPDEIFIELNKYMLFLDNLDLILNILLDKDKVKDSIIILNNNTNKFYIDYTVLNPWKYLKDRLWTKLDSCILTSATLKTLNSFDYIKDILDLDGFKFYELDSDFDYSRQSLLFIPNDLWHIKYNQDDVIDFLKKFLLIVKWQTLVLFTSFYMIKETFLRINNILKKKNINLYAQWITWWKYKMIDSFKKESNKSIILWTDTFWEWIDIPWNDLRYLIIHKIPFMVPNDPIFQARSQLFDNSFQQYSMPKAILKLKQGFWRLIRTKKDTWVVVFLDDRIYSTNWWKYIFSAFPSSINYKQSSSNDFFSILKTYIKQKNKM